MFLSEKLSNFSVGQNTLAANNIYVCASTKCYIYMLRCSVHIFMHDIMIHTKVFLYVMCFGNGVQHGRKLNLSSSCSNLLSPFC